MPNPNNPLGYGPDKSPNMYAQSDCTGVVPGIVPASIVVPTTPTDIRNALSAVSPIAFDRATGVITHTTKPDVIAGIYGGDATYPVITVDSMGHITGALNKPLPPGGGVAFVLPTDLAAIEVLTGAGYLYRVSEGVWGTRTLVGSVGRVTVTNVLGTDKVDLVPTMLAGGAFGSSTQVPVLTIDEYGRITAVTSAAIPIPPIPPVQLPFKALAAAEAGVGNIATEGMTLIYQSGIWVPRLPGAPVFLAVGNDAHYNLPGNVGIGVDVPLYKLDVLGTGNFSGDIIAFSDRRVKENIATVTNALSKVLALRGVTYTRTDCEDKSEKIGFIAQEVQEVLPQVVHAQANDMLGVSYGNIVAVLVEAVKEQQNQINELIKKLQDYATR